MKYFFKYSLFCFFLCFAITSVYAKSRVKKHTTIHQTKSKGKKSKSVKKKQAIKSLKLKKRKTKNNVAQYNEQSNANTLLKNNASSFRQKQADSIPDKVVTILSAFKPQLKHIAKVNFANASAKTDTMSLNLNYQIPSQNLSFRYKPIKLVPRAYRTDSAQQLYNNTQFKIGFGNYTHYYIGLNTSFQDIYKNYHTIQLSNESIDGQHHLQSLKELGVNYLGDLFINENYRINTQLYYKQSKRNRFGLVPDSSNYPTNNYLQNYYLTGLQLSLLKTNEYKSKIQFAPNILLEHFEGISGATNNNVVLKSPLFTRLNNGMKLNFDVNITYNQFNPKSLTSQSLYLVTLEPSLNFNKFNGDFNIGIQPAFKKDGFNMYPSIDFTKKFNDTNYILSVGWKTQLINNTYSTLVQTNPWLAMPTNLAITSKDKKFIGVTINANKHLNYGFMLSNNEYHNFPLYNRVPNTNNLKYGVIYQSLFERKASTIELDAFLNYQFSDKLIANNTLKYTQFNSLQENAKPWGILPVDFKSKMSWLPNSKWVVDGEIQMFTGATVNNTNNLPIQLNSGLLINAGFAYKFTKNWSGWAKGENLLNKPIERWSDYPSLGVQLIAGVVYSFRK